MCRSIAALRVALATLPLAVAGCANAPYEYSYEYGSFSDHLDGEPPRQVVIEQGQPNKAIDGMSDALTWPCRKLSPKQPDKRQITEETTAKLRTYLEANDLADVHVAVRQYAPRDQWRRLRDNKHLGFLDRYTFGALAVLRDSIFPAPVFNRNHYNPYTNTLQVNSDWPGPILSEAAFAKNVRRQKAPGLYLLANAVPPLSVGPACDSASELVGYARETNDWELEKQAYLAIYPRIGAGALGGVGAAMPWLWPTTTVFGVVGAMNGTSVARLQIAQREKQREAEANLEPAWLQGDVQQASFVEPVDDESQQTPVGH